MACRNHNTHTLAGRVAPLTAPASPCPSCTYQPLCTHTLAGQHGECQHTPHRTHFENTYMPAGQRAPLMAPASPCPSMRPGPCCWSSGCLPCWRSWRQLPLSCFSLQKVRDCYHLGRLRPRAHMSVPECTSGVRDTRMQAACPRASLCFMCCFHVLAPCASPLTCVTVA